MPRKPTSTGAAAGADDESILVLDSQSDKGLWLSDNARSVEF
jgi:hypothetical protein